MSFQRTRPLPAPRTPLHAITRPRFAVSAWPWRSLAYLVTGLAVMALSLVLMSPAYVPWIILLAGFAEGGGLPPFSLSATALLLLGGMGAVALLGPLAALPVGALERARLRLVHSEPAVRGA